VTGKLDILFGGFSEHLDAFENFVLAICQEGI
jgi:hypothetical protein